MSDLSILMLDEDKKSVSADLEIIAGVEFHATADTVEVSFRKEAHPINRNGNITTLADAKREVVEALNQYDHVIL